jgi:hypothetical protein
MHGILCLDPNPASSVCVFTDRNEYTLVVTHRLKLIELK